MRRLFGWLFLFIILAMLSGCARAVPPVSAPTGTVEQPGADPSRAAPSSTHTLFPTVDPTATLEPTASPSAVPLATLIPNESGLTIEENEIVGEIQVEPLKFQPLHGSQSEVMARHAGEKQEPFTSYPVVGPDGSMLVSGPYTAVERSQGTMLHVEVTRRGEVISRISAGHVSPITALRRLWVQDDHWTLEIAHTTNLVNGSTVRSFPVGRIYHDGVLLNDQYGNDGMFGYQLLDGKPFYFYKNDGQIHLSYNGEDLTITYDDVPHYRCCSGAEVNPNQAGNWVGFFGKRGETWFYTEIGKY